MYKRYIQQQIEDSFYNGKIIIIVGPRQVGKTTLSLEIIKKYDPKQENTIFFNCDNPSDRSSLNEKDIEYLDKLIGNKKIVFIDEGQKVDSIGQTAKLLIDRYKNKKQIIITGSSSINLLNRTEEALTGRKKTFYLYPISLMEIYCNKDILSINKELESILITGLYPDILNIKSLNEKQQELQELSSSNLYKDILEFERVKNSTIIFNLLKALALQIGSEVSYNELSNIIGIDKKTVERYIDLLEKNFIIFRVSPYYTNKRKEISKSKKIYFYDLGIRNSIINNFNSLDMRNDVGALWENFIIVERIKYLKYKNIYSNNYFWRTFTKTEIDWVEERDGKLYGFEFKYKNKKTKQPALWQDYDNSEFKIITQENFDEFIF